MWTPTEPPRNSGQVRLVVVVVVVVVVCAAGQRKGYSGGGQTLVISKFRLYTHPTSRHLKTPTKSSLPPAQETGQDWREEERGGLVVVVVVVVVVGGWQDSQ
ncbi:hypothetical protein Pcinc_034376 [Petrolisthes cinctipes]|uniref:Uncharacterized protein n=1 Tax=Petrolisthes cinctipes TaxID=88211 RepID=A0AAE1JWW0_PETCI|nr:hypothetical protein Pcinc_034376 [Petrolisthes cinctipes]